MDARHFSLPLLACASLFPPHAIADPLPLAVERGECTFTLKAEHANQSWWLVVGAAASSAKPFAVDVRSKATDGDERLSRLQEDGPSSAWRALRREQLARWQSASRIEDERTATRR